MRGKIKTVFVLLLGSLLSGCINTGKLSTFADYDLQKNKISKIYLVTDCFMLNEGSEFHTFDAEYNLDICNKLSEKILEDIERQSGIAVVNKSITAGMQAGPNIYMNSAKKDEEHVYLPVQSVDNTSNEEEQFTLSVISNKLSVPIRNWEQRQEYVNSLKMVSYDSLKVLALEDDSVVLFVQLTGLKIDHDRAGTETAITALLSLGTVWHMEFSVMSASAIMLDNQGLPIWGDAVWYYHEIESDCEINLTKDYLLSYFPVANMDNADRVNWQACKPASLQAQSFISIKPINFVKAIKAIKH